MWRRVIFLVKTVFPLTAVLSMEAWEGVTGNGDHTILCPIRTVTKCSLGTDHRAGRLQLILAILSVSVICHMSFLHLKVDFNAKSSRDTGGGIINRCLLKRAIYKSSLLTFDHLKGVEPLPQRDIGPGGSDQGEWGWCRSLDSALTSCSGAGGGLTCCSVTLAQAVAGTVCFCSLMSGVPPGPTQR